MRLDPRQRRLAIAQAFRDARTPSAEERLIARLRGLENQVAELSLAVRDTTERIDEIAVTGAESFHNDWPEEEGDLVETPAVPSLQSPGLMSAVASQALFGHA
jgi:hypothetical protein